MKYCMYFYSLVQETAGNNQVFFLQLLLFCSLSLHLNKAVSDPTYRIEMSVFFDVT